MQYTIENKYSQENLPHISYSKPETSEFTFNTEFIMDNSKISKVERLKKILTKMSEFLQNSSLVLSQKRLHREFKTVKALERMCYLHTSKFTIDNAIHEEDNTLKENSNSKSCRSDEDKVGDLIIPSGKEFHELLDYIENELQEKNLLEESSSSDSGSDNDTTYIRSSVNDSNKNKPRFSLREVKATKFEEVFVEKETKGNIRHMNNQKNVLNKENIRKHFLDLEYKIKVELKKQEIKEKEKAFEITHNTSNNSRNRNNNSIKDNDLKHPCFNNKNFYEKLSKSNIEELKLISPGYKFPYDKIKNFFKEDEETKTSSKRFSHLNMIFPSNLEFNIQENINENEDDDETENEGIAKDLQESCFIDNLKASITRQRANNGSRRTSFIKSSLFGCN